MSLTKAALLFFVSFFVAACEQGIGAATHVYGSDTTYKVFRIGALGDSISRGMSVEQTAVEDEPMSWSTGVLLPNSHYNRFVSMFKQQDLTVTMEDDNMAVSGDTVLGSGSQFQQMAAALAAKNPQYVTIEIGADDVCSGDLNSTAAVTAFQNGIENAIRTVMNTGAQPVVVVVSIPNIWGLTQIPSLSSNATCQTVWSLVCPALSAGQTAFQAQWNAANQALSAAAAAGGSRVFYDGGAVANTVFDVSDVSAYDCFHPSASGQSKIADTVWRTVPPQVLIF